MPKPNLTHLETLCWIARLGSFSAAAERLHTTQPAISRRIKELEKSLRISLFHRQGRKMELTIQGRDLVARAQPLLSGLDDVVFSVEHNTAATGTIRIGVGEIVALTWYDDFMARLKRDLPGVNYEVEVGLTINVRQKLELGALDLAIVAAPVGSSRVATTYLGTVQVQWLMNKALRAAAEKRKATVAEIFRENPLWCVARPAHIYPMAMETLRRYGVPASSVNTADNMQAIVKVVAKGSGIALLPTNLLEILKGRSALAPVSSRLPPERLDFAIASHRDQDQAIVKHIIQVAVETSTFPRLASHLS